MSHGRLTACVRAIIIDVLEGKISLEAAEALGVDRLEPLMASMAAEIPLREMGESSAAEALVGLLEAWHVEGDTALGDAPDMLASKTGENRWAHARS